MPPDHPILNALFSEKSFSVDEADVLYKEHVPKAKNTVYHANIKHYGFRLLCDSGLIDYGSNEQKKFYLEEQLNLERNFPSIANFYALLQSSGSIYSKSEMAAIGETFYNKNEKEIETATWPNEENKKSIIIKLRRTHLLFTRFVSVK